MQITLTELLDIVAAGDPEERSRMAQMLAPNFTPEAQRSGAVEDTRQNFWPRVTVGDADVVNNSVAAAIWGGRSRFAVLDFVGATGWIDTNDGNTVHIRGSGGGADCMFDYLVSSCWATEVTAGRGIEGQVMTSLSGCTFRVYSTIQLMWNYLAANMTIGGKYAVYLCEGSVGPLKTLSGDGANSAQVYFYSSGGAIIGGSATVTNGYEDNSVAGGVSLMKFENVNFTGYSAGNYAINKPANYGATIWLQNCSTNSLYGPSRIANTFVARDCSFSSTAVGDSGFFCLDMSGNNFSSWLINCQFSGTVRPGSETYFQGCTSNFSSAIGIDASAGAGGSNSSLYVQGHVFRSGGSAYTYYMKVGAYSSIRVEDCIASASATAAILVTSAYNYSGATAHVVGNQWGCALGMDIQSSSMANLLYAGNSGPVHFYSATPTIVQTSGAGNVVDSVFGPNGHSNAKYNITGSRNIFFPGDSAIGGSGPPGPTTDQGIVYDALGTLTVSFRALKVRFDNTIVSAVAGTIILPASQTNYVEINFAGTVSSNTTGYTLGSIPLAKVVTGLTTITTVTEEGINLDETRILKNTVADTTPGFLTSKLVSGSGVGLTTLAPAGNEQTQLALANLTADWTQAGAFDINSSGKLKGTALIPSGLTGAVAASRYVGATASGAPVAGTFAIGDFIIDQTGKIYVCTVAGTPGTWVQVGGSGITAEHHTLATQVDVTVASTTVPYQVVGPMAFAGTITGVEAKAGEAKTNGATSAIFDVHKVLAANANTDGVGTTIFTTQANRPTISNGNMLSTTTLPDVLTFAAGDYFCIYTDQSGTTLTVAVLGIRFTIP